ncbi:MAG: C69 family dipeptidase, partial [Rikenellaceae bacterium]|nr:C69 family dipeptidase [Rikenellaceae bacterium]
MKISSFFTAALAGLFLAPAADSHACTNILITHGASKNGSAMISYSADSHILYGELYHTPAATHAPGSVLAVYKWDSGRFLDNIAQVARTYSTMGNMNEYGLIIGESTFGGHKELIDKDGRIDYGSLIYITLQRAKTAREAIQVMGDLVAEYGYCSSGESFSIADHQEVWYMEMIGKGVKMVDGKNVNKGAVWMAVRVPDGYMTAHANQARLRGITKNDPDNCLYSPDVISFAREMGYFSGTDEEFVFCNAYNPYDFGGLRACEARVWAAFNMYSDEMDQYLDFAMGYNPDNHMPLWIKPNRKLDVKDVADIMRDHFDGTPMDMHNDVGAGGHGLPYRWRPMQFEVDGQQYINERAIATQQTGFWFVGEVRPDMPDLLSGIIWFGVDDAGTSCLTPIYTCSNRVPECFAVGNGDMITYSSTSAFWLFNRVTNWAYLRYDMMSADILRVADRFISDCMEEVLAVDAAARMLYQKDPERARAYVTNYSVQTAQHLFDTWNDLDKYLLIKYIDGNVKREKEGRFESTGQGRGM